MREYAAQCVTSTDDVRELMGFTDTPVSLFEGSFVDDLTRVRDALSTRSPRSIDDIARRSGLPHADVEAVLGALSLDSQVERSFDGWRAAAR